MRFLSIVSCRKVARQAVGVQGKRNGLNAAKSGKSASFSSSVGSARFAPSDPHYIGGLCILIPNQRIPMRLRLEGRDSGGGFLRNPRED